MYFSKIAVIATLGFIGVSTGAPVWNSLPKEPALVAEGTGVDKLGTDKKFKRDIPAWNSLSKESVSIAEGTYEERRGTNKNFKRGFEEQRRQTSKNF